MDKTPDELWERFKTAFKRRMVETEAAELAKAWSRHGLRTALYKSLLRDVAKDMGMTYASELFKVDFVMWQSDDDERVPLVFIESENWVTTAHHEVSKLTCIAAPLRILITVCQWDEGFGVWPGQANFRSQLLKGWQSIVRSYHAKWPRTGLLGIVVGEWRPDGVLRFYANVITPSGDLRSADDEVLVERQMAAGTPQEVHRDLDQEHWEAGLPQESNRSVDREQWEARMLPATGDFREIPFSLRISLAETEKLREGLIPQEMEDRWVVLMHANSVDIYRSWSGECVYRINATVTNAGLELGPLHVFSQAGNYQPTSDTEEIARATDLVRRAICQA